MVTATCWFENPFFKMPNAEAPMSNGWCVNLSRTHFPRDSWLVRESFLAPMCRGIPIPHSTPRPASARRHPPGTTGCSPAPGAIAETPPGSPTALPPPRRGWAGAPRPNPPTAPPTTTGAACRQAVSTPRLHVSEQPPDPVLPAAPEPALQPVSLPAPPRPRESTTTRPPEPP